MRAWRVWASAQALASQRGLRAGGGTGRLEVQALASKRQRCSAAVFGVLANDAGKRDVNRFAGQRGVSEDQEILFGT